MIISEHDNLRTWLSQNSSGYKISHKYLRS